MKEVVDSFEYNKKYVRHRTASYESNDQKRKKFGKTIVRHFKEKRSSGNIIFQYVS